VPVGKGGNTSVTPAELEIGDLIFYYHPMHHVSIYVGEGRVISHGMDPVGWLSFDYAPIDYARRYLVPAAPRGGVPGMLPVRTAWKQVNVVDFGAVGDNRTLP
jgi:cell wall-associated NlpC family hydrolase